MNKINHDPTKIRDFLLTADFYKNSGYSYNELIDFLTFYKTYHRILYLEKENIKRESDQKDVIIKELLSKLDKIEKRSEIQEQQIKALKINFSRKLSIWERIVGKMKF